MPQEHDVCSHECLYSIPPRKYECNTTEEKMLSNLITDEEEDDEEVYKMAGVMAQCGGLECMLNRLSGIKDFKQGRHLLTVRKLFFFSFYLPNVTTG